MLHMILNFTPLDCIRIHTHILKRCIEVSFSAEKMRVEILH